MVASQSPKRSRSRRARIAVLLAANAAALAFAWHLIAGRATHPARAEPPVAAAPSSSVPVAPDLPRRVRDTELEGRIRASIASAIREAGTASKGRASPAECAVSVHVRELGTTGELASIEADR